MAKKRKTKKATQDQIAHWYRQCPICYSGDGGLGNQYGRSGGPGGGMLLYFRCTQCGHTWKVERAKMEGPPLTNMSPPQIKHADVATNARHSDQLKEAGKEGSAKEAKEP